MDHFDLLRTGNRQSPGGNMAHILVIDDDAMVARALKRMLSRDHTVVVANTMNELLSLDVGIDAILTDYNINFPDSATSSGILKLLDERFGVVPLILISANAEDKATRNSPVGMRAKRILAKPVSSSDLLEAIAAALAAG